MAPRPPADADGGGDGGVDYYALLNLPRHAPREAVKAAYTRMARTLHPDKIRSLGAAEAAEAQALFILVDRAYKVLSSPQDRQAYDMLGHEGLAALHVLRAEAAKREHRHPSGIAAAADLQLAQADELSPLILEKVLGRVQMERELEASQRYNLRGAVQVDVAAQGLLGCAFEPASEYDLYDPDSITLRFEPPRVMQVVLQQSVEAAISRRDLLTLGAQTMTRAGAGAYSVSAAVERRISDTLTAELALSSAPRDPLGVVAKASRTLDAFTKAELELVWRAGEPGASVQGVRKLSETATGVLQLGLGCVSGLVVQLNHAARFAERHYRSKRQQEAELNKRFHRAPPGLGLGDEQQRLRHEDEDDRAAGDQDGDRYGRGRFGRRPRGVPETRFSNGSAMLFLGGMGFGVQASWARSISSRSSGRLGVKLGTANAEVEVTSSRRLSAHSKGNVSLGVGLNGVRLTLRYDRGGVRYVLPLVVSSTLSFGAAVVAGAIPAGINLVVSRLLQPAYRRRVARRAVQEKQQLAAAREKARRQLRVLSAAATARVAQAEREHGLIILRARYGCQLHRECSWEEEVQAPTDADLEALVAAQRDRAPSDWDDEEEGEGGAAGAERDAEAAKEAVEAEHPPNIDVTAQLNYLARGDVLEVHGGVTKAQLLGFYDPCLGRDEAPELFVRYQLGSWVFELTVGDLDPVQLPSPRAVLIGNAVRDQAALFAQR